EGPDRVAERAGAADRTCRPIERREEAVSCRVDLSAAKAFERDAHDAVMLGQEIAPLEVAERHRALGGSDDVREEHGGQHAIGIGTAAHTSEELLELVEDGVSAEERPLVVAVELDV